MHNTNRSDLGSFACPRAKRRIDGPCLDWIWIRNTNIAQNRVTLWPLDEREPNQKRLCHSNFSVKQKEMYSAKQGKCRAAEVLLARSQMLCACFAEYILFCFTLKNWNGKARAEHGRSTMQHLSSGNSFCLSLVLRQCLITRMQQLYAHSHFRGWW